MDHDQEMGGMCALYWDRIPDPCMLSNLDADQLWESAARSLLSEGVVPHFPVTTECSGRPVVGALLGNSVDAIISGGWKPTCLFFRLPLIEHEELLWKYQSFFQATNPEISIGWVFSKYVPLLYPFCRQVIMRFRAAAPSPNGIPVQDRYDRKTHTLHVDILSLVDPDREEALSAGDSPYKSHEFLRYGKIADIGDTPHDFDQNWINGETKLLKAVWEETGRNGRTTGQFVFRLRQLASILTDDGHDASAVGFPLKTSLAAESVFMGVLWLVYQADWNEMQATEVFRLGVLERRVIAPLSLRFQSCLLSRQSVLRRSAEIRAAAAAIMARNKSHNLGSHVTPRSRLDDLRTRVEDLLLPVFKEGETSEPALKRLAATWISPNDLGRMADKEIIAEIKRKNPPKAWVSDEWEREAFPILQGMRDDLDDYAQRKDEFVAEFSTDPLISTRAASFYREVILPFIENTGLTDTLAANEGFRYTWDTKPGIVVRCFVRKNDGKAVEIEPTFHPEKIPAQQLRDAGIEETDSPPYGMHFAYRAKRDVVVDIRSVLTDPRVALPGPVGEMAFYGILENVIRNAAKHGGRSSDTSANTLEVHVVLTDQDSDYYRVAIYENLSSPEEKLAEVAKLMQSHIDKEIVDASGECRKEAWGTAEMKLCADLLCGATPGASGDKKYELKAEVVNLVDYRTRFSGEARPVDSARSALAYTFSIRKAWTAVFLGFDVEPNVKEDLKPRGFRFESGKGLVTDQHLDLPPAFQFAVLHAGLFDGLDFDPATGSKTRKLVRRALRRLPFRIIACGLAPEASVRKFFEDLGIRCVDTEVTTFEAIEKVAKCSCKSADGKVPAKAEALTHWLWQSWLNGLRRSKGRKKPITTDLYFHQSGELEPTVAWKKQADVFKQCCAEHADLNLRVWAKTVQGPLECLTDDEAKGVTEGMRVIIDRHGEFISDRASGRLSEDDCLVVIDKGSSDFGTLYNATFNAPWQLPYELAEAGLLQVLVLDERIAQRAGELYPATEKSRPEFREALTGSKNVLPRMRDVADRAGICIPVHLRFCDKEAPKGRVRGQLLDLAVREWRALDEEASANGESSCADCVEVHLRQGDDLNEFGGGTRAVDHVFIPKGVHLVVVHQGIIDLIKDKYGKLVANGFVNALSSKHWAVIESGRGIPPEVQQSGEKFLSFSLIDRAFHGKRVAKLGLIRHLMEVTRNREG